MQGSSAPTTVTTGYFTGPTTSSASLREWQAPCPTGRTCTSGVVLAGVDFGSTCPSGAMSVTVNENTPSIDILPSALSVTTPGYSGTLNWTVAFTASGACLASRSVVLTNGTSTSNSLRVGTTPLDATFCNTPFKATVTAARTADIMLYASCAVTITVLQVGRQPFITDCRPRNVSERSVPGTAVGAPLVGGVNNTGTTLLWSVDDTSSPVYIDACTGGVRVRTVMYYATTKNFTVPIRLSNSGLPPLLSTTCNLTVSVLRVNQKPSLVSASFFVNDLSSVGTYVGTLEGTDPDPGDVVGKWNVTAVDSPDAFAVNATSGVITVKAGVLDILKKATYSYTVAFTDGWDVVTAPITITLKVVPRPPTTFAQSRVVSEAAAGGAHLPPALNASHPQGTNFSFVALAPATPFGIFPNGTVYLLPGYTLDYNTASTYTLVFSILDAKGLATSDTLTVTVTEVNKPPRFPAGRAWTLGVNEGSVGGTAIGNVSAVSSPIFVAATDPNTRDTLRYTITGVAPPAAAALFDVNVLTGLLTVAAGVPGGVLAYDETLAWPSPRTATVNISATDNGTPRLWDNATATVTIQNVKPRLTGRTVSVPANAAGGTVLDVVKAWTPYPAGIVMYDLTANDVDLLGRPAFVINATGGLALATFANATPPSFDFNVRWRYNVTVRARDINGLTVSAVWVILLNHVNRPPVWSRVPLMFAASLTSGTVGVPLATYVTDPDSGLGLGENLTYRIRPGLGSGNTDGTFGVVLTTGQVFVANNATPSFAFPPGALAAPTYNITVEVSDAGVDGPVYTVATNITIQLTVNQIPPDVSAYNLTVAEHVPVGTVVGTVAGSTVNVGYKLTYSLAGTGANAYAPFPFNITTTPGGSANVGVIRVTGAAPIEFWGTAASQFRFYAATLTVTDNNPTSPLSRSAPLEIWVTWVHEPPYFDTVARRPASVTFSLRLDEHSPPGTLVTSPSTGSCLVRGYSKDPWQNVALTYRWSAGGAATSLFAINATTGCVTVAAGAGDIAYNNAPWYVLTAEVRDVLGATDTATVNITVADVNDPAVWAGVFDLSGANVTATGLRVPENATTGTVFGYVRVVDPDRSPAAAAGGWGAMVYGTGSTGPVGINATTGAVYLQVGGTFDWWDSPSFMVTAAESDTAVPSLAVYLPFRVTLVQVNTVAVSSFSVAPGTPAAAGVNGTAHNVVGSPDATFTTRGGTVVYITGRGFGRTARRLAAEGATPAATAITATYGPRGVEYAATGCSVLVANTVVRCVTTAGVGSGHIWTVIADGWPGVSTTTTAYFAPDVTAVVRAAAPPVGATEADQGLTTAGEPVLVNCTDCGPAAAVVTLRYGRTPAEHGVQACTWVVPQVQLRCATTAGVGSGLVWQLTVGGQSSDAFNGSAVHYAPPTITAVAAPRLDTGGHDIISLTGTNFGPAGTSELVVTYAVNLTAASGGSVALYTATNCTTGATTPHTGITCNAAPGVGCNLTVAVAVAGQGSPPASAATASLCYKPPVLGGLAGMGKDGGNTQGGQQVILTGSQFGPVTPLLPDGTPTGPSLPAAYYAHPATWADSGSTGARYTAAGCFVAVAGTKMVCATAPGVGAGLVWRVEVGGQTSPVLTSDSSSYHPPIVASYAPTLHPETAGGEVIAITGAQFGPAGTPIDGATYGPNGTEFVATNCSLVTPHTQVQCTTAVGAGAGLKWFVTVDGQRSVTPSTAYAAPEITGFAGPGAVNGSTDGGAAVVLTGRYFSVAKFLGAVTYGATGVEFSASNCTVTTPHTAITCNTVPGTGRYLRWAVTVGGQPSAPSIARTSYAPPAITALSPTGVSTLGGVLVTATGTNFGVTYPAAAVRVLHNARALPAPPADQLAAYWDAVYDGSPEALAAAAGMDNVTAWLASLPTFLPTAAVALGGGVHAVTWRTPAGFGAGEVIVMVDGVPSRPVRLPYGAPVVASVSPDRQGLPPGLLRITVDGSNFCNGADGCGVLVVNGDAVATSAWDDNTVVAVIADLAAGAPAATVVVVVGGVASNTKTFLKPVPAINALAAQGEWGAMATAGGQLFWVAGVGNLGTEPANVTIGPWPCVNMTRAVDNGRLPTDQDAEFTLTCVTPPGVGVGWPVVVTSFGGPSRANSPVTFSYAPPAAADLRQAGVGGGSLITGPARVPTVGAPVVLTGSQFGAPGLLADSGAALVVLLDDALPLNVSAHAQGALAVSVPPGDGMLHYLRVMVAGQASDPLHFNYAPPSVAAVTPAHGPTLGGTVVTVHGANFGVSTSPSVTLGGVPCALAPGWVPAPGHDTLACVAPHSQGVAQAVVVSVSGQVSGPAPSSAGWWSYDAPAVVRVTPDHGPTSGRTVGDLTADGLHRTPGARIVTTLTGTNLGMHGVVAMWATEDGDPLAANVSVPAGDVLSWNDTTVVYYAPEGFGYGLEPRLWAGQWSGPTPVRFDYDPPTVLAVMRADRTLSQCQTFDQCFTAGNTTRCRTVTMGCYPTRGGFALEVVGASFGPQATLSGVTEVTVGGRVCAPARDPALAARASHTSVLCIAAAGVGENLPVVVAVGGRASAPSTNATLSFDPPVVTSIVPNTPDARGSQDVAVKGWNYGTEATPLAITVDDEACGSPEWLNDGLLRCSPPAQAGGAKNVSISVANRTAPYTFWDVEEAVVYLCQRDYYGLDGEVCLACPTGGVCPGSERYVDLLNSTAGYWRSDVPVDTSDASMCDAPRRLTRTACPVLRPCEPAAACLGGNTCAEGYVAERCAACLPGKYYRMNGECVKCPSSMYALYIGLALVLMAGIGLSYYLQKKNISVALLSIGVDYLQVLSMFSRTKIVWPALLKTLFNVFSAFNLNIEITAPECLVPDLTFATKWFAVEVIPLAVAAIMLLLHAVQLAYKRACLSGGKKQQYDHVPALVATSIVLFRMLYMNLTKTSFDVLNCTPTDPPEFRDPVNKLDPIEYMAGVVQPEYVCWKPGGWQVFLYPFGLCALLLYSFAIPGAAICHLRRNVAAVTEDQVLRAKGTGNDALSNPRYLDFRRTWGKLYAHLVPRRATYWEGVIALRKLGIAGTSLAFRCVVCRCYLVAHGRQPSCHTPPPPTLVPSAGKCRPTSWPSRCWCCLPPLCCTSCASRTWGTCSAQRWWRTTSAGRCMTPCTRALRPTCARRRPRTSGSGAPPTCSPPPPARASARCARPCCWASLTPTRWRRCCWRAPSSSASPASALTPAALRATHWMCRAWRTSTWALPSAASPSSLCRSPTTPWCWWWSSRWRSAPTP